ncbi:hypothetical protein ITP53_04055 [Nonomuraea sp. K274]|uniref:PE-PGRS family protein n=1 Tax=Nonomuraea cypriaca TaxID=1187855 RepID=A0A931EW74_9ACTN|nr:hypothetical protein [Nonomuraea cypriaca]MBF8184925.1 hypothetical protein [Nonomuraea cypriaca]
MEVGEEWAYRERPRALGDPVHRVTIVKIRDSDDSIRIRRLDGDDAGLQEWVSYTSLLDRWAAIEPRLNDERRLLAVREVSTTAGGTVEYEAALLVVKNCGLGRRLILGRSRSETGVLRIDNPTSVAERLGLTPEELGDGSRAFHDRHGVLISPWQAAQRLIPTIASVFSEDVMEAIHREEAEFRDESLYGNSHRRSWEDARDERKVRLREREPVHAMVRQWCGQEAVERFDELIALRNEVVRLGQLLDRAVEALRKRGATATAATIESDLGVPIAMLMDRDRHT